MKRKERSVSVERGSGQVLGREQRQGVDGRGDDTNDVKEIVSSSRERIMNTFGKSLEIIESKNGQLDSQDAEWQQQRNAAEVKFKEHLESLKNSCSEIKSVKVKLNKYLKEIKRNKELLKKENRSLATLNSTLHEQEKVFLTKIEQSGI